MHILLILLIACIAYFGVAQPLGVFVEAKLTNAERRKEQEKHPVRFDAGDRAMLKMRADEAVVACIPKEMRDKRMIEEQLKQENPDLMKLSPDEKERLIHDALVQYYRNPATPPPYVQWVNSYPCPSQEWRDYLMELGRKSHNTTLGNPKFPDIP